MPQSPDILNRVNPRELASLERQAAAARLRYQTATTKARTAMLNSGMLALGDFEAARRSRTRPNTHALKRGGSADSHRDRTTRFELAKQCESLLRNDKLARSLVRRRKQFVVGDAIGVQVRSDDTGFNKAAEKFLTDSGHGGGWMDSCEHAGHDLPGGGRGGRGMVEMCGCAISAGAGSGDCAIIPTREGFLQFIESERIIDPPGKSMDQRFVNGVEYDTTGRVQAYHIADWGFNGAMTKPNTRRVPASSVLYIPNPSDDQPNLTRPEPGLSALVKDFDRLRTYSDSVAIAATMATYFGLVISSKYAGDVAGNLPGASTQTKTNADGDDYSQKQNELEPGFVLPLEPGETATQIDPKQPTQVYSDYLITNLALMGSEGGVPLVLWLLDFRQVNFHSARSAVLMMGILAAIERRWLRMRLCGPACRWRLALEIKTKGLKGDGKTYGVGDVPDGWDKHDFIFPPMPVVDPKDQYAAEALAVDAGFKTFGSVVRALNGRDPDEHMAELAAEREKRKKLGILPVGQPGTKDPNAASQDNTNGQDNPPADPNSPDADPNP
ncbi:MAG TPA: phage portal protein [Pseudomonadota bacterium]|nr:phage portal protein [Pseudomonadota bacterium]